MEFAGGAVSLNVVFDEHPSNQCKHSVIGAPIGRLSQAAVADSAKVGTAFDAFSHKHGIVLIGSVVDGDRGLVVMCQICMHNHTRADRTALREETHKYYTRRLSKT